MLQYTISLCFTCKNKKICKHYKYFRDNEDVAVNVKECDSFEDKNPYKPMTQKIPQFTETKTSFVNKHYPDLSAQDTLFKNPVENKVEAVNVSKVICDRCKNEVLSTEIDNCVECGRAVCKDCGVGALENGKLLFTCEKCWSGTPDPDPNNPEEVTITYGEESNEWDMKDFEDKSAINKETTKSEKEEKKDVKRKKANNKGFSSESNT